MNIVYAIRNKINGKCYVGSTTRRHFRWLDHARMLKQNRHHAPKLQMAYAKYGKDNLVYEVLEVVDDLEHLGVREQHHIDRLNSYHKGYNTLPTVDMTDPVEQSKRTQKRWADPEQRRKQSELMKSIWNRPGWKKKHLAKLQAGAERHRRMA